MGKQHQQPARDGQVLLEMQELIAVAELAVEQHGSGKAEARQQQRGGAGVIAHTIRRPQPNSTAMANGKSSPGMPKARM
jgi:hypothetical protein